MGYQCFTDDNNEVAILVTNLANGETLAVCPEHLADYAVGLLQAATGVTWAPAADEATDPASDEPTDEDEAGDGPTSPDPEPGPAAPPPVTGPGSADEDQADEGDQVAEDNAAYEADLRELAADRAPY
jgi:hypothetical protein